MSISESLMNLEGSSYIGNMHSFFSQYEDEIPDDYYKFSFVRNPFSRIVSFYKMILANKANNSNTFRSYLYQHSSSFPAFLRATDKIKEEFPDRGCIKKPYFKSIAFNQFDYLLDSKANLAFDFIGRFENLQNDYNEVLKVLGINMLVLNKLNSSRPGDYREFYSLQDIEFVYSMYKKDFSCFNYVF